MLLSLLTRGFLNNLYYSPLQSPWTDIVVVQNEDVIAISPQDCPLPSPMYAGVLQAQTSSYGQDEVEWNSV